MRLTLREYIDNPDLLDQISMSELQTWASEVPYAGLIHRLMILKTDRNTSDTIDVKKVLLQAVISSSDPSHIINLDQVQERRNRRDDIPEEVSEVPTITSAVTEIDDMISADHLVQENTQIMASEAEEIGISDSHDDMTYEDRLLNLEESAIDAVEVSSQDLLSEEGDLPDTMPAMGKAIDDEVIVTESDEEDGDVESSFTMWLQTLKQIETKEETDAELKLKVEVASESLAQLLADQGYQSKAIEMYDQLILKYPEKSSFFAGQIEKIKAS